MAKKISYDGKTFDSYMDQMDYILKKEQESDEGLVGIKFGTVGNDASDDKQIECMANAFCFLNELEHEGLLARAAYTAF